MIAVEYGGKKLYVNPLEIYCFFHESVIQGNHSVLKLITLKQL